MRWWVLGWWVLGQPSSNSIPICFGWFSLNMSPHLILWTTLWGRYDHSHSTDTLRKWCARAIAASRVSGCAPNMSQHGRPETILESIPKRIKESDWKLRPHTSKMQMTSLKSAVVKNLPLKKKKKKSNMPQFSHSPQGQEWWKPWSDWEAAWVGRDPAHALSLTALCFNQLTQPVAEEPWSLWPWVMRALNTSV